MRPICIANNGTATRAAPRLGARVRVGIAVVVSLAGVTAHSSALGAESTANDVQASEPQQVGASNGGVASATTGGDVDIGQIITGENTGNSIATGDISGSAEISGGEIDYPTDVTVSLILGPPIATADGGDAGTANSSDDSESDPDDTKSGQDGEDITIINRNDNRSNAKVVNESLD